MNARIPLITLLGLSAAMAQAQTTVQTETDPQTLAQPQPMAVPDPPRPAGGDQPAMSTSPCCLTAAPRTSPSGAATTAAEANSRAATTTDPNSAASASMTDTSRSATGPTPSFTSALPVQGMIARTENGVTYICGGVGKEEAAYMKRHAREHDMLLTFATARGKYLADVHVTIENARGEQILRTTCDGPLMAVDLPQGGRYRVHAEAGGLTLDRTAHVNGRKRMATASLVMAWPESAATAASVAAQDTDTPVTTGSSSGEGQSASGQPETVTPE